MTDCGPMYHKTWAEKSVSDSRQLTLLPVSATKSVCKRETLCQGGKH